jgi:Type II secretion system (T2SS), protein E, N-terminal domain
MSVYEQDHGRPTLGFRFGSPGEPLLRPPAGAARPATAPEGALASPAWPPVEPEVVVRAGRRAAPEPPPVDDPPAAERAELPVVDMRTQEVDPEAALLLSPEVARFYTALPYAFEEGVPLVALADESETAMKSLRLALGRDARFVRAGRLDLLAAIASAYTEPRSAATGRRFRVVVRLSNDELVDVASFGAAPAARTRAAELVDQLASGDDPWPFVRGRFLRPDAVVSVDIVEDAA